MAYQKVDRGSTANDGTGDTLRVGADKINENFEDLFAKINGVANSAINDGAALTSDNVVLRASTDTLTNKTIAVGSNTVSGTTAQFNTALSDGSFATLAGTETLAAKTLTAPKIVDGGFIADANGAEQVIFQTTASAVNEIEITNAATGGSAVVSTATAPIIGASGETNVDLALLPKGTGITTIRSTGGTNNQGMIRLNCEANTHGQTLMSQPHASGDSGFFMLPKASTAGNARATPDVLLSGDKTVGTTEAVNSPTALSLDTLVSEVTTTGSALAISLANGVVGQIKIITLVADGGGTATLTPAYNWYKCNCEYSCNRCKTCCKFKLIK